MIAGAIILIVVVGSYALTAFVLLWNYKRRRRPPSLFLAWSCMGWVTLALHMGLRLPQGVLAVLLVASAFLGTLGARSLLSFESQR